jgi:type IV secretion system protein VirB9
MTRALACLLLLSAGGPALAFRGNEDDAAGGRIRYVDYDPDEVVTIEAVVGVVVHIVLDPSEKYVAHAFGDGKAWDFAVRENHCFVKPVATDADSNLTIVTDKRSYHLALRLRTEKGAVGTYELAFRYREPRKVKEHYAEAREIEESFQKPPAKANLHYSMSGDEDIAPVNCWDNGEVTSFKFAGGTDVPAIYMVDADGNESIVDRHTTGPANEIVVVHKVAKRWVLRLGLRALAVWNDAYSGERRQNDTGTAAPDVKRVLWK